MADLTITAANVAITDNTKIRHEFCGEAFPSTGSIVCRSGGVGGQYYLADQDDLLRAPSGASEYGITLNRTSAAGQPVALAKDGASITLGAILAINQTYHGSTNAGRIGITTAFATSTDSTIVVGTAISTTTLPLNFHATGVATP